MSDYMFMLENHLNAEQSRFVSALQAACIPAKAPSGRAPRGHRTS